MSEHVESDLFTYADDPVEQEEGMHGVFQPKHIFRLVVVDVQVRNGGGRGQSRRGKRTPPGLLAWQSDAPLC